MKTLRPIFDPARMPAWWFWCSAVAFGFAVGFAVGLAYLSE